jgi:hemoglobin-like flavoprotein
MTPTQIDLVQSSFDLILPISDETAALFYSRLFHLDPTLRPLFGGDMRRQGKKLMDMISVAVRSLATLERIVPSVRALGQRHVAYGVHGRHYDTVGAALLWTLEQGLGEAWSTEVANAWATTFSMLASTMKQAAAEIEAVAV